MAAAVCTKNHKRFNTATNNAVRRKSNEPATTTPYSRDERRETRKQKSGGVSKPPKKALTHPATSTRIVRRCPTLPQGPPCSTIGAKTLSFRVRNVTGRFHLAITTETLLTYQHTTTTTMVAASSRLQAKNHTMDANTKSSNQIIGVLVPVSSTHYCASTSGLSTQSSTGHLSPKMGRKSHLEAGFPLRCFQRLSVPNVANQPCPWQNN